MGDNPINVAGLEIPSDSPIFLAALGVHVLAGISCVGAGVVAMLSGKRPGRHPRFGTIYYYCLSVVFASATMCDRFYCGSLTGPLIFARPSPDKHNRR
jgi:hypothetical protein